MALSRQQQREIIARDNARRADRAVADYLALKGLDAERPTINDVLPNHHRDIRVSPRYANWPTRVVGIATGTEDTSDGTPTVRIRNLYDDSVNEIRTVREIRSKGRTGRRSEPTTSPVQSDVEKFGLVNNIGADYSE